MAKFCSECGAELAAKGKFCGSCGAAVVPEIQHCPTCGQEWDGNVKHPEQKTPPAKPRKSVPVIEPEVIVNVEQSRTRIAHNTKAAVQPMYGPLYVEGKDCPNCGTANMANKTCKTCESEN